MDFKTSLRIKITLKALTLTEFDNLKALKFNKKNTINLETMGVFSVYKESLH